MATRETYGYGRYRDDPEHVGCPRARTDMTPCIARDGASALDDSGECVGCGAQPETLLIEIHAEQTDAGKPKNQATRLANLVRKITAP